MNRNAKIFSIIMIVLLIASFSVFPKSKKSAEGRFQLGIGGYMSTNNILGLIEDVRMVKALKANDTTVLSAYPGLDQLDLNMRRAVMVANILGGMEYGIAFRLLWKILMVEADVVLLPFNGSYNGRLDFSIVAMAGIRAPFWIMPYAMAGITFNFSFYPADFIDVENWKRNYGGFKNFLFRPGMNIKLGLDFKFKHFSLGAYYLYSIKDFDEFGLWFRDLYNDLTTQNYDNAKAKAAGMIFGAQSKFGVQITRYIF